ncbi:MAG: hypothetical protein RL885_14590 [Planctomycetota bacterium]
MYEDLILEEPQRDLLVALVEAERSIPRERRGKFFVSSYVGEPMHLFIPSNGGPKVRGSLRDAEDLAARGFLSQSFGSRGTPQFWVAPEGFAYYQHMRSSNTPMETVEQVLRSHLSSSEFQTAFPRAYRKWADAETLLWSSESLAQLTTIGHLCREAMQEFASALAARRGVPAAAASQTVQNVRASFEAHGQTGSATATAFRMALLAYWGCVSDLVQRQEHGGQREGSALTWEDGRRVVFQTLIVMYELSKGV